MNIEDYRIRQFNQFNLVVERRGVIGRGDNKGQETWRTVGYYGNPKAALRRIRKELAMEGFEHMESLEELLEWLKEHAE
jgi:hypothetical protein